jgi:hypothetical protein
MDAIENGAPLAVLQHRTGACSLCEVLISLEWRSGRSTMIATVPGSSSRLRA